MAGGFTRLLSLCARDASISCGSGLPCRSERSEEFQGLCWRVQKPRSLTSFGMTKAAGQQCSGAAKAAKQAGQQKEQGCRAAHYSSCHEKAYKRVILQPA